MTSIATPNPFSLTMLRSRFVAVREWLGSMPLWVIQFFGRIAVGGVFLQSGMLKLNSWEFAVQLFVQEYKVPLLDPVVAAWLTTYNEIAFSILLFLGLATRLATLPLLGMVLVIQTFVYPNAWPDHLMWTAMLGLLLTRGPGVFSLDYLIERHFAKGD